MLNAFNSRVAAAMVLGASVVCAAGAQTVKTNPEAQLLQDFQSRIDAYMKLHDQLERRGPKLKETSEPAEIKASQEALAGRIRAARKDAKPGDIFTPEIRALFRRLMYPETSGAEGAQTKQTIKEDAPAAVPMKVNGTYPESQPLPTVPPNLLASLPELPDDLEYRIVGRTLLLRDVHANIIVDFVPNAIR